MKRLLVFAATLFCLCSCAVDIDREYNGYADIVNETTQTIKVTISILGRDNNYYPAQHSDPADGSVKAGDTLRLYYWDPEDESLKYGYSPRITTITLEDGSEITCSAASNASWSRRFFDNCEYRESAIRSHLQKHKIVIETYRIDEELLSLWQRDH